MNNLPFVGKFKITKFYGVPGNYIAKYHTGIDIVGLSNSKVYSVCDGIVKTIHTIDDNSYGKYVKIVDDATGKIFLFAHLNQIFVSEKQVVNRATIIGEMGNTGNSKGPHTHIELRTSVDKYGNDEDPAIYMGLKKCSLNKTYNSSDFQLDINIPNLKYAAYCQNLEWQEEKKNGEMSGLYGKGLRIEAIIINADINIQYRVHMAEKGWGPWVPNGCMAGTTGESRRIEAIEIQSSKNVLVGQGYVENIGYQSEVRGTQIVIGTEGKGLRLEGFKLKFE